MSSHSNISTDVVSNVTAILTEGTGSTEGTGEFSITRIYDVLQITIIIIGTVGSVLMLTLLVKEKGKKTSYTICVGALSVNDILNQIFVGFVIEVLYSFLNYDIYNTSNRFICKSLYFIRSSLFLLSGWLVLTLTTEQLINAYFPRVKKLFKRRMPGIVTVTCLACSVCYTNIHYVVQFDIYPIQWLSDGTIVYRCDNVMKYYKFLKLYQIYIFPVIAGILPGLFILIENVFLIKTLRLSIEINSDVRRQGHNVNRDKLVFTILISVQFLLMEMPFFVMGFQKFGVDFTDVFDTLQYMSHSFKCFVYILCKRNIRKRCNFCQRFNPNSQEHVNTDLEN